MLSLNMVCLTVVTADLKALNSSSNERMKMTLKCIAKDVKVQPRAREMLTEKNKIFENDFELGCEELDVKSDSDSDDDDYEEVNSMIRGTMLRKYYYYYNL
jgi:hypothetical protein